MPHDAVRIGAEHDLQQHLRRIRGRSRQVIVKARVESRQVNRMLEQVMDRVLEGAGQELLCQIDRQEAGIRIDILVAGHAQSSTRGGTIAMHDHVLQHSHEVFLQPR